MNTFKTLIATTVAFISTLSFAAVAQHTTQPARGDIVVV